MIDELIERVEKGEQKIRPSLQHAIDETCKRIREAIPEREPIRVQIRAHKEQHDGR